MMTRLEVIVDDGAGVAPAPAKDAPQTSVEEEQMTKEDGQKASGLRPNYSVLVARLAIITLFAVSVSLLTILTWFWTSQSTRNSVNSLGSSLRHEVLNRSAGHMLRVLSDQAAALHVTEQASYYQYQLTGDILGLEMRRQLWGVVSNPNYDLKCASHAASGKYSYLDPDTTRGVRTYKEIFANDSVPLGAQQVSYNTTVNPYGERTGPTTVFQTSLDKRLRPYYTNALSLPPGIVYWSTLYSDQLFPVMVASTSLLDNVTGAVLGVNTVSQGLGDLSHYISLFDLKGGILYFKTADDILLATSGSIDDFLLGGRLRLANESLSPTIQAADAFVTKRWGMEQILSGPHTATDVTLLDSRYYVDTLPIQLSNLQVVAVLAIPRASIMGAIDARGRATVIFLVSLSSAIFVLGCVLVVFFTMRVSSEVKLKAELDAAKRRAEAHSQAKSMFLSNVSHELRTPMAGIMGLLDLLAAEELAPEQAVNVAQIKQCATSLLGLLNNLLDLGKIEAGRLELESADFDLGAELESIVDMFAVQCTQQGIEIGLDLPGDMDRVVKGDQARVRQVVVNLLSNAVKFSSAGGHIAVRAWPVQSTAGDFEAPAGPLESPGAPLKSPRESSGWFSPCSPSPRSPLPPPPAVKRGYAFEVEDTGIGIPPEKREKVFENFVQADSSTTRLHGGTGLGLGIVRSLVGMMGGDIYVADKDGPGTLMRFTVFFDEPEDGFRKPEERLAEVTGQHVFLAMAGDLGRQIAEKYLTAQGLHVHLAQSLESVVPELNEVLATTPAEGEQPALVILDAAQFDEPHLGDSRDVQGYLRELAGLQNRARVAWLVSSLTPAPIRQLLKASFPVAYKPLYSSRLSALLLALTSPPKTRLLPNGLNDQLTNGEVGQTNHELKHFPKADISPAESSQLHFGNSLLASTPLSSFQPTASLVTAPVNLSAASVASGTRLGQAQKSLRIGDPRGEEPRPQTSLRRVPSRPLEGLRVLVAEDTPILQKLTVKMLSKLGAVVQCVDDGQQAAAAVIGSKTSLERPFDVVLMDCQMPIMDGYQATREIRQAEAGLGRYTPIIALTAHAMASDRDKCLATGMDHYLSKPLSQKDLVSALRAISTKDKK